MRVIWTLKQCLSRQIIAILQQKEGWKPSTVKTLLKRLVEKQLVKTTKQGRGFVYTPNIMEMKAVNVAGESLFKSICAMDVGAELSDIIDKFTLSQSDIQMLIKQLQDKKLTAPDKVDCDCLKTKKNA